jgi:hypothetical protein
MGVRTLASEDEIASKRRSKEIEDGIEEAR